MKKNYERKTVSWTRRANIQKTSPVFSMKTFHDVNYTLYYITYIHNENYI